MTIEELKAETRRLNAETACLNEETKRINRDTLRQLRVANIIILVAIAVLCSSGLKLLLTP